MSGAGPAREPSLSDDLLGPSADLEADQPTAIEPVGAGDRVAEADDDLYLTHRRLGRTTIALLAALVFGTGGLVGSALTRALTPKPPPEVVYVLNGSTAPPSAER